ncbi:MAG: murein hydrolase activator EnvC family protein [Acidimicrobiia bacterium]
MAVPKPLMRIMVVAVAMTMAASLFPQPIVAVTKSQVDEACRESRAQLAEYREAQASFKEAALALEEVLHEIDELEQKQQRILGSMENRSQELEALRAQVEEQAVQLYMMGGFSNPGIILSASSVDEFMASSELLSSVALGGKESIDSFVAARNELARFQEELEDARGQLTVAQGQAADLLALQEQAMEREREAYSKLSGKCRELNAQYQKQLAEARAALARRAAGSVETGPFICPFTRGRTSFIDTWGAPRSGGRTHKGTDMFAAWNEPVYAVTSGRAYTRVGGLGGYAIWLIADNGIAYYYAHLASFNIKSGQRVSQGKTIGFNGNSGNAMGGPPHVHFQLHPGGRGSPAVNPYPTLVGACK